MAEQTPITATTATEAVRATNPSTNLIAHFDAFLEAFQNAIAATRDLNAVDAWDPAFADWRRAEEFAWEATSMAARGTFQTPVPQCVSIRPLRSMARLVHHAIGSEDRAEFELICHWADAHPCFFTSPDAAIEARLDRAKRALTAFATLDLIPEAEVCRSQGQIADEIAAL